MPGKLNQVCSSPKMYSSSLVIALESHTKSQVMEQMKTVMYLEQVKGVVFQPTDAQSKKDRQAVALRAFLQKREKNSSAGSYPS